MMRIERLITDVYNSVFGKRVDKIEALPRSGSERRYFRIYSDENTMMGVYNPVVEENEAFIGFSGHFRNQGLPVPEIYSYHPGKCIYFLQDLGSMNLFSWIGEKQLTGGFDRETISFYKKVLDKLVIFQTRGVNGLDTKLCYPHKRFDRQSMLWDVNYFKYMYLKLLAVPFNEASLELDFDRLISFLLESDQESFLYRDFQSANIMVVEMEPWFIDYQGGRLGAPQYDLASLLYDSKIKMINEDREMLLDYYADKYYDYTGYDKKVFKDLYAGFSLIRVMQACGSFGFRGLYEKKPTFTETVVPGGILLNTILPNIEKQIDIPELAGAIRRVTESELFERLSGNKNKIEQNK